MADEKTTPQAVIANEQPTPQPILATPIVADTRILREPESVIDEFFLKEEAIGEEKRRTRIALGMTDSEKKPKKSLYERLKFRLYKAGIKMDPANVVKLIIRITVIQIVLIMIGAGYLMVTTGFGIFMIILYIILIAGGSFILFYPMNYLILKVFLLFRIFKRRLEVERVLPEFLRLVATNYRSGMPLDKALLKSNRPRFGVFSTEIELVAKTARVNGDLAKALEIFGKKYESKILQRAMNNIVASITTGSNISNLLEDIASNITKMRNMQASMAANVKNYVIFIIVAAIIIAPLMFSMSYVMNSTIAGVKASVTDQKQDNAGAQGSLMDGISEDGGVRQNDFNVFALLMLITNSVVGAFIISMIKHGNFSQGVKHIPVFLAISIVLYLLGKNVLATFISVV